MKKIFTILGGICIVILSTISFIFAYTQEQREAYEWAYKYKITTQPTIETANLDGNITRQAFAKMIVNYLENVIGINQTSLASCKFSDENKITNDLKHYSKKTCSYKIMGSDGTNFNPTKPLTRVQLGTVLSRIIWGDRYNTSGEQYYINHLNALKQNGIMSNIGNYQSNAKRGDVLIMLKRLYEKFGSNIYMNQLYHGSENNIYIDSAAKDNIITERDNSVSLAKENSVSVEKNDGNVDGDIIRILKHDVYNTTRKGTNVIKYDDGLYERVDQNGNKFKFSKITISDGNNSITMMDRNLGASNATSEGRKDDYDGCYFQWGNNNCFTGKAEYADGDNYLRTDILHETPEHFTKSNNYTINPVKWSNEYLHKGYFGSEFVVGLRDYWENDEHYNEVWGGEKDGGENNWGWNTRKETQINRQGPCPEGWHIPSIGERRKVIEIYMKDNGIEADGLTKILDDGLSSDFSDYFFLPNASNLNYDNMYNPGWYNAGVWTSSPYFEDENSAYVMYVYPTQYIDGNTFWSRGYGFPVRCFQNYDK